MLRQKLLHISFSTMRHLVNDTNGLLRSTLFLSKDFGVAQKGVSTVIKAISSFGPVLFDDARIGLVTKGEIEATVNLMDYKVTSGTMVYIGRGSIAQVHRITDDAEVVGMTFSEEFLNLAFHGRVPRSFNGMERNFFMQASPTDAQIIGHIIDATWDLLHSDNYCVDTVYGQLVSLMSFFDIIRQNKTTSMQQQRSREREIFDLFISLVSRDNGGGKKIKHYADEMCLSERYLGLVVRQVSTFTAKTWIDRAVITHAKVLLLHTELSVSQIASRLDFPNDSFFCKFFRRMTGISCMEYRQSKGTYKAGR